MVHLLAVPNKFSKDSIHVNLYMHACVRHSEGNYKAE